MSASVIKHFKGDQPPNQPVNSAPSGHKGLLMRILSVWIMLVVLPACHSVPDLVFVKNELFLDQGFVGFDEVSIETESDIFDLNDEAKAFARSAVKGVFKPQEKVETLVQHIFSRSDLNLLYRADANTVANQTFQNRAANCLSMSIMTFALAKELGFEVRFQDIKIPEYWTIREGQSLLNRHINLQIIPRQKNRIHFHFKKKGYEVDFDAQGVRQHFPKTLLTTKQVVAMFHNNNGADALLKNDYIKAYAYFRSAILRAPKLSSALANLGYLYRLTGHYEFSENAYLQAIEADKNNLSAWRNLSHLYQYIGQHQKAEVIVSQVARKRASNPFFHINNGDKAFEKQQWKVALRHYQRALKLDRSYHEVYFGLGKTYFALGDVKRSQHFLQLAKKKSRTAQEQSTYQGKLKLLTNIKSG